MSDAKQPLRDDFSAADDVLADVLRHEQDEDDIAPPTRWQKILARMVTSRELVTLAVVIILFLFFTAGNPRFASVNILIGIARRITPIGILSIGITFLLIAGELDLSVGASFGFAMVLFGQLASERHWDTWLSLAMAIAAGLSIGVFNGTLVTRLGVPSFIATLGMLAALRGAGNALAGGVQTYAKNADQFFYQFFNGNFPGTRLPNMFVIMLILTLIAAVILATTKFASDVYATGGNAEAARNNGIATRRVKMICFVLVGGLAGLAGAIQFGYIQYAPSNAGVGFELQVIAAAIIGGVGLFGGRGTILGSLLGAVILAELTSGLVMIGARDYWDGVAAGVVIVVAVALDGLLRRGAARALARASSAQHG
ncbi:MAG: ABC transporter permease [Methylobacteriaceae bacterium]|nr:ABC transporter permease [Methylobacteriaceae bacterium]